jgi:Fusaric acid resistance protein family
MADAIGQGERTPDRSAVARWVAASANAARAAGPPLLFGLRLWASVCLALYVAFWLELDNAFWAGTSAGIVCHPHLGASLRKGWFRMIGTLVGVVDGFGSTLTQAGSTPSDPQQPVRRELMRKVIALDPVVDEAIEEVELDPPRHATCW